MVEKQDPERFRRLLAKAEHEARQREAVYRELARLTLLPDPARATPEPVGREQ
jgi:hypothetical protein